MKCSGYTVVMRNFCLNGIDKLSEIAYNKMKGDIYEVSNSFR
jgi:hypothetical protein